MDLLTRGKHRIVEDHVRQVGRHDQPGIFGGPPGDLGLVGGPDSVSWRLHSDVSSIALGGIGAIIMEILHPSVMAGVQDQSSYREDPERRIRTTYGYVVTTTFGNTAAAERLIGHVRKMHGRVNGTRPDGVPYRALDPHLIAWVHTCIPWAIMLAYERFNQPLSVEDKNRYLAEQAVIGRMGGADEVPTTVDELDAFVEAVRPELTVNEQTIAFFDFLLYSSSAPPVPKPITDRLNRFQIEAGMSLMPRWAQHLTGFEHSGLAQSLLYEPMLRTYARELRWAFGTPPWRELAEARVRAGEAGDCTSPAERAERQRRSAAGSGATAAAR